MEKDRASIGGLAPPRGKSARTKRRLPASPDSYPWNDPAIWPRYYDLVRYTIPRHQLRTGER